MDRIVCLLLLYFFCFDQAFPLSLSRHPKSPTKDFLFQKKILSKLTLYAEPNADAADSDAKTEVQVDDLLASPVFLKKKIAALKKSIETKKEEIDLLKAEADKEWEEWGPQIERIENDWKLLRARSYNDTAQARMEANYKIVKVALDTADNFGRAQMSLKPSTDEAKNVNAQYQAVYANMEKVFFEMGVSVIKTVGEPFDYNLHQAVMSTPSEDYAEDIICQEFQKGYILGESVLRPAMVSVSLGPGP